MRLTEAIDWYNKSGNSYSQYSHFQPTDEDIKAKAEYKKNLKKPDRTHVTQIDIFE